MTSSDVFKTFKATIHLRALNHSDAKELLEEILELSDGNVTDAHAAGVVENPSKCKGCD